jgi:hypothetical protein
MVNGGVWKTTDAGRTWKPIFDDQPTGSIGWVAVAPSDPNILYVGSGEGLPRPDLAVGDGVYKSTDAGADVDAPRITRRAADPEDCRRPAGTEPALRRRARPSLRPERGARHLPVHRRRPDFERVLFKDANTGGKDVDIDPSNPDIVYATMWEQRQGRGRTARGAAPTAGSSSRRRRHHVEAADAGTAGGIVNAELAIAPSNPRRVYATLEAATNGTGIFRSDDAGETWTRITTDTRPTQPHQRSRAARAPEGSGHAHRHRHRQLQVDRRRQDVRAVQGRARRRRQPEHLVESRTIPTSCCWSIDQGAVVTLNGGQTWSSWFTQPTAALYHVMTDNAFPYRVCGGQQDSGSVCVASRGNDGQITFRDWHPVGVEEYGYAAPDPRDPDLVYGGKVTRYDRRTGQVSTSALSRGGPRRAAPTAGRTTEPCEPSRSSSRQSIRTRCSTATTCCGRRSTAGSTGSRSART